MTKNTQGSEWEKKFENADRDPGTAYELGRHDERLALLQKVRECLFMYTHQWVGDDKERVCENCREVVGKWTACEASQSKASDLASDLLSTLAKLEGEI